MNAPPIRWSAAAFVIGLFTALSSGCVTTYDGYDYGVGVGVDYYEPYGGIYGGWGDGYLVAPFRDGGHRPPHGDHPRPHAYKSAPGGRPVPSVPWRSRHDGSWPH